MDEPEVREALRESFARFATDWVAGSAGGSCRIALMRVQDFLRLAPPVSSRIAGEERFGPIDACLDAGTPFATPLELILDVDGDEATVVTHDGRHRAMRLLDLQSCVPVHIVVEADGAPDDALDAIETIFPESHDDDEDYPGWEPEDLEDRSNPVKARDVFLALMKRDEVVEILETAPGPRLG